jgi:uncharacterized protein (DUF1330 family)
MSRPISFVAEKMLSESQVGRHRHRFCSRRSPPTLLSLLSGAEPPNRVVIVQFANMDAVKAWRDQGAMDMENTVGNKYASFRIYAVEGVTQ